MKKIFLAVALSIGSLQCYAQDVVSGYLNTDNLEDRKQEMVLSVVESQDGASRIISTAHIQENGFFAFPESVFSPQDQVYKISVRPEASEDMEMALGDFGSFILSKGDQLHFSQSGELLGPYSTTNKADKEWQKFKQYENRIHEENSNKSDEYLTQTRNYTKDSLQILLVKLLSIKTLDEKKLLEKDINENADFYLDLLDKLQNSDLQPASYAFLETKIRATHQDIITRKYQLSLLLNFLGVATVLLLSYMVIRLRKKSAKTPPLPLSKQEEIVKRLILEGKTNKEIAAELFISISTVKSHISNIYSKLNISSRKELVM